MQGVDDSRGSMLAHSGVPAAVAYRQEVMVGASRRVAYSRPLYPLPLTQQPGPVIATTRSLGGSMRIHRTLLAAATLAVLTASLAQAQTAPLTPDVPQAKFVPSTAGYD